LPGFQLPLQGSNLDSSDPEALTHVSESRHFAGFHRGIRASVPDFPAPDDVLCREKPHQNRTTSTLMSRLRQIEKYDKTT
jgi:hypothetical protein